MDRSRLPQVLQYCVTIFPGKNVVWFCLKPETISRLYHVGRRFARFERENLKATIIDAAGVFQFCSEVSQSGKEWQLTVIECDRWVCRV
jgi:hypothetical protein